MSLDRLLAETDATGLAALIRGGEVTPVEAVEASIARAERLNPTINALVERLYDNARTAAAKVDRTRPFAGVPFAIKDLTAVMAGVPMHAGSHVPPRIEPWSSRQIDDLTAAGFIHVATVTSPEWGLRIATESRRFGATRNPWNPARTSGGSSGGSASVVAAGIVPVAHASDGGGSIRIPASLTGLVGLKPSRGRVPLTPLDQESWFGFIVQHALTRSVRDSAALLDLTAGVDHLAPYRQAGPTGSFLDATRRPPGRLRIGVHRRSLLARPVDPAIGIALDKTAALARDAGHDVAEIDLPIDGPAFLADFCRVVCAATAGNARMEAARTGGDVLSQLDRTTRTVARFGEVLSAGEVTATLTRLQAASMKILEAGNTFDLVLMPVTSAPAIATGALDSIGLDNALEEILDRLRLTRLLRVPALFAKLVDQSLWFAPWTPVQNVTGQPAIALPVHVTPEGLPVGVQAVGRIGEEATLLAFAAQIEPAAGWRERRAPLN
jgi:amidase